MTTTTIQTSTRLETIAARQKRTRVRDALFAACVTLAAALSIVAVSTATRNASSSHEVAKR